MANWHSFKALQRFFLFDVLSNSLFLINEDIHNYLQGNPVSGDRVPEILAELTELRSMGYLSETAEDEPALQRDPSIKALCLHVSHDCNLRCRYCFASTGSFGGKREQMSLETGKRAIDLLLRESGERRQLEVDFFGGEPLLNLEVVRNLVEYGRAAATGVAATRVAKEIHFTLTTNGLELDGATREFLTANQISLVLSLDGRPEVNDAMRGQGSYERALPNMLALVKERGGRDYYLRGTYTANNLDFTEDVKHLYTLGFRELSLEPVVDREGSYRLTEAHLDTIKSEYEKLAEYYLEKQQTGAEFRFFHFEINLEHGPCLVKRLTGCGAGFDYFAVTPSGELYPCHQFVGREEFIMGDVDNGIYREELRRKFGAATLYRKKGCWNCWSRFFCSGGCHANAHLINGSIYKPDPIGCELQKKRLECALALKGIELYERNRDKAKELKVV
ncbi:MAG TPA: thioether cross-link-forming SCIFF peptide maturase [Bacillota bacterium]|nr:thioether cross-link-forming SCIFF peptide maturase [Bacillota bacterium]